MLSPSRMVQLEEEEEEEGALFSWPISSQLLRPLFLCSERESLESDSFALVTNKSRHCETN